MMSVIIAIHIIACAGLISVVLVQRGRGGGFIENLSGLDSVFGTRTSSFLTRFTTIFAVIFFITSLGLAIYSVRRNKSLLESYRNSRPVTATVPAATVPQVPVTEKAATTPVEPVVAPTQEPVPAEKIDLPTAAKPASEEKNPLQEFPQPRKGDLPK